MGTYRSGARISHKEKYSQQIKRDVLFMRAILSSEDKSLYSPASLCGLLRALCFFSFQTQI